MVSRKPRKESYPMLLWLSAAGALAGSLEFGYQIGVLNTALPNVVKGVHYNNEAVLSSAVVLGAALGALIAGQLADKLGPKRAQIVNCIPFITGAIFSSVAPYDYWGFLLGRLLSGFGAGAASLYTPRYIAEISPPNLRGKLGSQNQVFINVGIALAYMVGIPYEHDFSGIYVFGHYLAWWRAMMVIGALPSLLQVLILAFCPESPVWLESKDREEADDSCIKLWGSYAIAPDVDSTADSLSIPLIDEEEEQAQRRAEGWTALGKREYRLMMALAIGLPLLQQASGINTVIYYSSDVFRQAGLTSPILGSILMALVNVGFTLLSGMMMDKRGRVPLLQFSYAGMAACLVAVAATIYAPTDDNMQGLLTVGLIILYVMCFAMGCGPIPWVYLSEILPERIKGTAAALGTFMCWTGNLVVTLTFQKMLKAFGLGGTYLFYAVFNLLALWYISSLMVETKCRTLDEIEQLLLLPAAEQDDDDEEEQQPLANGVM